MTQVSVLGAGAFGTALAIHSHSLGHRVRVWAFDEGLPEQVKETGENQPYLPGFAIPPDMEFTNSLAEALDGADLVLLAVPSSLTRLR